MAEKKIFVGGEFLITEVTPDQVFTPEDYTEEHRMIYDTAKDFVIKEVDPIREKIEAKDTEAIMGVLAKAGELGFLATDIPEEYGGLGLDKVSTTVVTEALGATGSFTAVFWCPHRHRDPAHCLFWQ